MHFLTIINHKKHHHNDHIMHGIGASICSGTRSKFSGSQCFIFLCISSLKNTDQYCNKEQISTIIFVVVQTDLLLKIISFLKRQMDQQNEHKTVKKLLSLCKAKPHKLYKTTLYKQVMYCFYFITKQQLVNPTKLF
jgi:hypothetical protein